ncbi:conserved hypothetical protein [Roseibium sp. TrichSKD4]|uniref:hypothetical protein n=1 Tax=Roseibium sp. TrichSKD4 TaxID=744980 RepID=UPI0001E56665|nr:hypothetical protein [Roseibium sp. TrichSKD4]EFO30142.1 conserved hypothetical protein [Roseibium sp. TrichSKD4]EFO33583.1 conserved hypothetical protein [Roseibium sp. TrichSKD4]
MVTGRIGEGVQQAHIRYVDHEADKPLTGMGRKPDDRYSLPLWWEQHQRQHSMNEREFWEREGKNPLLICARLQELFPDTHAATIFILAQIDPKWRRR